MKKRYSKRRDFLGLIAGGIAGFMVNRPFRGFQKNFLSYSPKGGPIVLSTWRHGLKANKIAIDVLRGSGTALDAVEKGVRVVEGDPENVSVGIGGLPDRDGNVTLDASIMNSDGNCGSVCFLRNIKHPVSVARQVMEESPHVMLAGEGALQFALARGFTKENLLTEKAKQAWLAWKTKANYQPEINIENHDTIGMLAVDKAGDMAGACTTSGIAFKMHGRVGDSPIIGAGLYVDNEVGGAVATGLGEAVIKTAASFLVVELMRQGAEPAAACKEALQRINRQQNASDFQVGLLALRKDGEYAGYALQNGFDFACTTGNTHELVDAPSLL